MPPDAQYEIPLSSVRVEQLLGKGAFGLVYRGQAWHLPPERGGVVNPAPVAIKTLRGKCPVVAHVFAISGFSDLPD